MWLLQWMLARIVEARRALTLSQGETLYFAGVYVDPDDDFDDEEDLFDEPSWNDDDDDGDTIDDFDEWSDDDGESEEEEDDDDGGDGNWDPLDSEFDWDEEDEEDDEDDLRLGEPLPGYRGSPWVM